ncbi:hypothetical protein MU1_42980 [Paenibacillus glycanilyticus]|uniref:Uncharacterized protein n=1 Tax=Paenibacillus glycanilyticus TaxID=126569 RepID=A0ABQ6GLP5_9BACL|nr:hypothetical protein MU1_42980 [Paenibacillus glycanilyticus]
MPVAPVTIAFTFCFVPATLASLPFYTAPTAIMAQAPNHAQLYRIEVAKKDGTAVKPLRPCM